MSWAVLQVIVSEQFPLERRRIVKLRWSHNNSHAAIDQSSPTNLGTLQAAMLQCQQVSMTIAPSKKTIITFDMQLFIKAEQLIHSRPEFRGKFILIIGELHEVFAQCKAIGKYIDGSGQPFHILRYIWTKHRNENFGRKAYGPMCKILFGNILFNSRYHA